MTAPEPERALIRRVSPFAVPAAIVAFVVAALFGGAPAGWSAVIAIAIVYANFVANALSIAWAATVSTTLVSIVAGFLLSFVLSLDDFVITNFVRGQTNTFPTWVFGATRLGMPPQVNVWGSILFGVGVLLAGVNLARSSRRALA